MPFAFHFPPPSLIASPPFRNNSLAAKRGGGGGAAVSRIIDLLDSCLAVLMVNMGTFDGKMTVFLPLIYGVFTEIDTTPA